VDKIKPILQAIVKYRFWIVCGVVTPLLAGGWYTTTAHLQDVTNEGKGRIDRSYTTADSVFQKPNHPNDFSLNGMDQSVAKLTDDVFNAWGHMYDKQTEILVWPENLTEEFIEQVEHLRPIETLPHPTPPKLEIRPQYRELYRDYIQEELPKLAGIIGAKWSPASRGGGGGGSGSMAMGGFGYGGGGDEGSAGGNMGGGQAAQEVDYIVDWESSDQSSLQNSRFDWSRLPEKTPRTLDILYAQEDLWVLRALMKIIAATNYDATGNYNATIKEISFINIGKTVGASAGHVARVVPGGASGGGDYASMSLGMGGGGGDNYADMMSQMMGMTGDMSGDFAGVTAVITPDPADERYVDHDFQPVSATNLREALTSGSRDPANAYLVVAKRMPIRMSLVMDQRRVHRLITACGNSDLMVEVRQVRVNKTSESGAVGGMTEGYGDSGDVMDMSGMMEAYGGSGEGGLLGGAMEEEKVTFDIPVEIFGMVYIYNPMDTDKLGIEMVEAGENPLEAGVDPAGPDPLDVPLDAGQPDATLPDAAQEAEPEDPSNTAPTGGNEGGL
jgi:hypothetical protein